MGLVTWKTIPFSVETLVGCQRLRICAGDREPEHPRARAAEVFWGMKGHWKSPGSMKSTDLVISMAWLSMSNSWFFFLGHEIGIWFLWAEICKNAMKCICFFFPASLWWFWMSLIYIVDPRLLTLGFLWKRPASLLRIHRRNIEHMASTIPKYTLRKGLSLYVFLMKKLGWNVCLHIGSDCFFALQHWTRGFTQYSKIILQSLDSANFIYLNCRISTCEGMAFASDSQSFIHFQNF